VGKLQTGRFERLAARTYSIKGPGALVDLDETVLGVVQLERQAGMEAHLMQEWETFGRTVHSGAGGAGTLSWVLLSNPVGSGRLMVVDGWRCEPLITTVFITRGVPPGFTAAEIGEGLDTRIQTSREPSGRIFTQQTAIGSFGAAIMELNSHDWHDYPLVLAPDGSVCWRPNANNTPQSVSMRWAERDAAPFELQ